MRRTQRSTVVAVTAWLMMLDVTSLATVEAFVITSQRPSTSSHHPTTKSFNLQFRTMLQAGEGDSLMDKLMDATPPSLDAVTETAIEAAAATSPSATATATPNDVLEPVTNNAVAVPMSATDGSSIADLSTVALVAGQENYGLAIVLLGEAIWSFAKAPSIDHALKTLLPAIVAAVVLVVVSGPMITSQDASSVFTGLGVATAVSVMMGVVYAARLAAPYSPSPKEIPALGLLVAAAGFFSFSQNLVVDGFVTLPSLPTIDLPSIELPF